MRSDNATDNAVDNRDYVMDKYDIYILHWDRHLIVF